jgi:2-keto-3-deoxy-L-rhamnonate aldolase RhmA
MSKRSLELKKRLRAGETTIGCWLSFSNINVAEILAGTGFDWVLIDTEHGPFGLEGLQQVLVAFNGSRTVPIVRVPWNDAVRIKQVLDLGADGVLVPMVNSPEEARLAIAACKYPPEGTRGFGPRRASDYGRSTDAYVEQANDGTIVMLQIEHVKAVARIDAILRQDGIDIICLGPTDLSGSAGVLRQFTHPVVVAAVDKVIARAKAKGIPVCAGVAFPPEVMQGWIAKGANFVLAAEDSTLFRQGASDALARMRAAVAASRRAARESAAKPGRKAKRRR